jgi:hypothetical protein
MRQDPLRALFLIGLHSRISIQRQRQRPVRVKQIPSACARTFVHPHSRRTGEGEREMLKRESGRENAESRSGAGSNCGGPDRNGAGR